MHDLLASASLLASAQRVMRVIQERQLGRRNNISDAPPGFELEMAEPEMLEF